MGLALALDERTPLVEECEGCLRADEEDILGYQYPRYCGTYLFPDCKWRTGDCPGRVIAIVKDKREKKRRIGRVRNIVTYNMSKYRRDIALGKRGKRGKKGGRK